MQMQSSQETGGRGHRGNPAPLSVWFPPPDPGPSPSRSSATAARGPLGLRSGTRRTGRPGGGAEEGYLRRSCRRVLKQSAAEPLVLVSGEQIRTRSSGPWSEMGGHSWPSRVAMVCSRPVVSPSNTCLFTLRPNMDLSSSGTYSWGGQGQTDTSN